jgi:ATP-binding cassette subfamily F protein 3
VASYPASFDDYVYRVQSEIDSGLRAAHTPASPGGPEVIAADRKTQARADREAQRKLKGVERKIARLDEEKRAASDSLLSATDVAEAEQLHARVASLTAELAELEDEWLALSEGSDL